VSTILKPGAGLLFMKVGMHAQESLNDIVERKLLEIQRNGIATWGYGGSSCHPRTMVQPFAKRHAAENRPIHLVMESMKSKHDHPPVRATHWSTDKKKWEEIPEGIDALGSKFALIIGGLHVESFELPLDQTRVALGPKEGRQGSLYIKGQCDKACLEFAPDAPAPNVDRKQVKSIGLVAKLVAPYAVFLR
jgi:hypothetical protein